MRCRRKPVLVILFVCLLCSITLLNNENLVNFDISWLSEGFDYNENFVGFIRSEHLADVNCGFFVHNVKTLKIGFFVAVWNSVKTRRKYKCNIAF
jgi:hypothetical protein